MVGKKGRQGTATSVPNATRATAAYCRARMLHDDRVQVSGKRAIAKLEAHVGDAQQRGDARPPSVRILKPRGRCRKVLLLICGNAAPQLLGAGFGIWADIRIVEHCSEFEGNPLCALEELCHPRSRFRVGLTQLALFVVHARHRGICPDKLVAVHHRVGLWPAAAAGDCG